MKQFILQQQIYFLITLSDKAFSVNVIPTKLYLDKSLSGGKRECLKKIGIPESIKEIDRIEWV